jgi:CheY-like chemotaxis protein
VLAGNGEEALEVFQTEQPDLVILDWMMPILDGPAAARTLRAAHPNLPIILTSGAGERAARRHPWLTARPSWLPSLTDVGSAGAIAIGPAEFARLQVAKAVGKSPSDYLFPWRRHQAYATTTTL